MTYHIRKVTNNTYFVKVVKGAIFDGIPCFEDEERMAAEYGYKEVKEMRRSLCNRFGYRKRDLSIEYHSGGI